MTETNGHSFGIRGKHSAPLNKPSPERFCREESLRVRKNNALLAFLGFAFRQQGTEQHSHAAIQSGWGHHMLPYHARCPE